jgi:hypothetical protein
MLVDEQGQGRSPASTGRARGDAGAGLVGLIAGTLIFLTFLLFACHLLLNLYARSIVAGAAFDGAQYVARHGGGTDEATVTGARAVVAGQVGNANLLSTRPVSDGDFVEYTVEIKAPRVMARSVLPWTSDSITRTARVRVEKPR